MEVLAAQGVDPRPVPGADVQAAEQRPRRLRLEIRRDHRGAEPFLGERLGAPVEGRDHGVAAGLDRRIRAEDRLKLTTDLPGEVGRLVGQRDVAVEDGRLRERRRELCRGQLCPA